MLQALVSALSTPQLGWSGYLHQYRMQCWGVLPCPTPTPSSVCGCPPAYACKFPSCALTVVLLLSCCAVPTMYHVAALPCVRKLLHTHLLPINIFPAFNPCTGVTHCVVSLALPLPLPCCIHLVLQVRQEDVLSTWSGIRPLAADPTADASSNTGNISRDHLIFTEPNGLITITGMHAWSHWQGPGCMRGALFAGAVTLCCME